MTPELILGYDPGGVGAHGVALLSVVGGHAASMETQTFATTQDVIDYVQQFVDVLGQYDHRRVALQEVRFAVEDATRGRQFEHRLMDFNNLAETQFRDVKRVLQVSTERVATRLRER